MRVKVRSGQEKSEGALERKRSREGEPLTHGSPFVVNMALRLAESTMVGRIAYSIVPAINSESSCTSRPTFIDDQIELFFPELKVQYVHLEPCHFGPRSVFLPHLRDQGGGILYVS